jgi:hypothetical protein
MPRFFGNARRSIPCHARGLKRWRATSARSSMLFGIAKALEQQRHQPIVSVASTNDPTFRRLAFPHRRPEWSCRPHSGLRGITGIRTDRQQPDRCALTAYCLPEAIPIGCDAAARRRGFRPHSKSFPGHERSQRPWPAVHSHFRDGGKRKIQSSSSASKTVHSKQKSRPGGDPTRRFVAGERRTSD